MAESYWLQLSFDVHCLANQLVDWCLCVYDQLALPCLLIASKRVLVCTGLSFEDGPITS